MTEMVDATDIAVGERVGRLRETLGITRSALAERAGLSPSMVGRIESGLRNASRESLELLARELGCTVDFLRTGESRFTCFWIDGRGELAYGLVAAQDPEAARRKIDGRLAGARAVMVVGEHEVLW